jgi:hypothetical protein
VGRNVGSKVFLRTTKPQRGDTNRVAPLGLLVSFDTVIFCQYFAPLGLTTDLIE